MNTASHVKSAVTNFNGSGQASVKKNDGVSGGLSESQKARLRRNVPDYLRSGFSWLCFEFQTVPNRDRVKKVPIDPETGQYASYKDPAAWGTLEEAIAGCARFAADGVGYAFMHYANIVGLDLDNCRNPATGEIDQWARELITGDHLGGTPREIERRSDVHMDALKKKIEESKAALVIILQGHPAHPPFGRQRRLLMMTLPLSKKPAAQ